MHLAPCLATPAGRQDPASDNAPTRRTRIHAGPIARLPLAQLDHPSRRSPALPLADTTLDHQALSQQPLTHAPRFGPVAAWNLVQPRGRPPEPTTLRSTWWGRVVEPGTGARNAGCDRTKPPATRSPDERVGSARICRVQAHSLLTRRRTRSTYLAAGSCRRHRAYRVVQSHQERRLPPSTSASGTSFRRVASCDVAGRRLIPIKDLERWLTGEASRPMP
jgi:hypothetical protein